MLGLDPSILCRMAKDPRAKPEDDACVYERKKPRHPSGRRGRSLEEELVRIYEQPVVPPQLSHFRQVPLRTSVKLPHSGQLSPS